MVIKERNSGWVYDLFVILNKPSGCLRSLLCKLDFLSFFFCFFNTAFIKCLQWRKESSVKKEWSSTPQSSHYLQSTLSYSSTQNFSKCFHSSCLSVNYDSVFPVFTVIPVTLVLTTVTWINSIYPRIHCDPSCPSVDCDPSWPSLHLDSSCPRVDRDSICPSADCDSSCPSVDCFSSCPRVHYASSIFIFHTSDRW